MTIQRKVAAALSVIFFVLSTAEVVCSVWWGRALLSLPLGFMAAAGIAAIADTFPSEPPPPSGQ